MKSTRLTPVSVTALYRSLAKSTLKGQRFVALLRNQLGPFFDDPDNLLPDKSQIMGNRWPSAAVEQSFELAVLCLVAAPEDRQEHLLARSLSKNSLVSFE